MATKPIETMTIEELQALIDKVDGWARAARYRGRLDASATHYRRLDKLQAELSRKQAAARAAARYA